jgi:predicted ArsR family transcriptional regulator
MPSAGRRFWSSTRGRVLVLLRKGEHTVNELAAALELTDNAVRSHLTALERDGLVRPSGTRRGPRKPTVKYELSPEAEQLFPRAYGPILGHLLDTLRASLTDRQLDDVIRTAGRRIAGAFFPPGVPARTGEPADRAMTVLRELGGCCERESDNRAILGCSDCPLGMAAAGHPEVCQLVETILADVLEVPVRQHCRQSPPKCRFEIDIAPERRKTRQ